LRSLDPWRRLLAAFISVNAWSLAHEIELAWVLFQVTPDIMLKMAESGALVHVLRGRVRNLGTALRGLCSLAVLSSELEEVVRWACEDPYAAREWLVRNVYGLGRKGASMFLRDSGVKSVYPLDRHVLRWTYGVELRKDDMSRIWSSAYRYREAERAFEEKALRVFPELEPALTNVLIFVSRSGWPLEAVAEYIKCIEFFSSSWRRDVKERLKVY